MKHLWMISYDISNSKIRRAVSKQLENNGVRVQYSVFECRLDHGQQQKLYEYLNELLEDFDKIRWYPLCKHCERSIFLQGKSQAVESNEYYLL
ncbi:MAG: CRISPR-associated endonuclease Cas2 [Thiotrichaceae bacterium]|nr:CRISPR-associated endonuclease Cas2 [Thiotrichaceae bacterium]